ncbi:MAG: lysostaphin resistance A-like protein [Planctomycetota bacterium]|jgi:membrane protease YdiL (CAAX protease family)
MDISEAIRELTDSITPADIIICVVGVVLFGIWLVRECFGRGALADSVPRRNNMPVFLPFVPMLICFLTVPIATLVTVFLPDLPEWQGVFLDNLMLCIGAVAAIVVIIFIARNNFARRLNGFGLNVKTIFKDFFAAIINLLSVWPLVLLMIIFTMLFGKVFVGPGFEIQRHEELESITAYSQVPVSIIIIITACLIMPVFEEMLFRGLFQTMIRSFLVKVWLSILISSVFFAIVHPNIGHWPALFVLAICLGYSYEKSGSLFRPIFIHVLFNSASIVGTLLAGQG